MSEPDYMQLCWDEAEVNVIRVAIEDYVQAHVLDREPQAMQALKAALRVRRRLTNACDLIEKRRQREERARAAKAEKAPSEPDVTAQAVELLRRVEARLRRGWTQGARARSASGRPVQDRYRGAVAWDLFGAFNAEPAKWKVARPAMRALDKALGTNDWAGWNDEPGRTVEQVLDAVGQAIGLLERGEAV